MGNKKKVPPSRRKSSLKTPDSVNGDALNAVEPEPEPDSEKRIDCVKEFESPVYPSIKMECERAVTALRRGNHNKAIRLLKEASHKYKNSALIHRVQATAFVKAASVVDDPNVKGRHFKNALESARRAVELSPNSIEFAFYHAKLLCDLSTDAPQFEQVRHECEKALGVDNPIDPAKESLLDESQHKISTAEQRIANIRDELNALIHTSHIKSLSNLMKTFGHMEDKITIVPLNRTVEDPMDPMLLENRKPNEIRKANKTTEERRKEVEVRVAAARLLQQKPDSPPSLVDGDGHKTISHFSSEKSGDTRKSRNDRKNISLFERRDRVRPYWNSMSMDSKHGLFEVRVCDMKTYFASYKDRLANDLLCEALDFAEAYKTWTFWMCCRCFEKFADPNSHIQHVVREHMGNLVPRFQSVMPSIVENEWVEMILNCSWKPLDLTHDVDHDQPKCPLIKLAEDEHGNSRHEECTKDSSDFPAEDIWYDNQLSLNEFDQSRSNQVVQFVDSWPPSDDPERAKLLDRIHALFQQLIHHRYLSSSHLNRVIQFTVDELQGLASRSELLKWGVGQSPTCICLLSAPKLGKILTFLQDVAQSCGLASYPEESFNPSETLISSDSSLNNLECIILSEDMSFLRLDELLDSINVADKMSKNCVNDERTTSNASAATLKFVHPSDYDALLSWIYSIPQIEEQLSSWVQAKEQKLHRGLDILKILEKEFCHLQDLCERKCDHLGYEEALQLVEDLCLQEGRKKELVVNSAGKGYESLLKKRRDEIFRQEHDAIFTGNRSELDAITSVLREAESLNLNQMGYDGSYCDVTSYLRDLEYCEEENWRSNGYLRQMDTRIEIIIQRQKEQLSVELSKLDAKIMRVSSEMHQMEVKLESVSAHDFRAILLPLVKCFLQAHLEDLAEKDATKKSDAIREALLAELALDSQKKVLGGKCLTQDKVKEKKKSKDFRKTKTKPVDIQRMIGNGTTEKSSSISSTTVDSDPALPDPSIIASDVILEYLEELPTNDSELEAEERKLQETLDYQRRVEYEAKQKHLAERYKKTTISFPGKLHVPFDTFSHDSDHDLEKQINLIGQELGCQRNGFKDNDSGLHVLSMDGTAPVDAYTASRSHKNRIAHSYHCADLKGNGARTLQLLADNENEDIFQADLKKAVQQSLEIFETHQELSFGTLIPSVAYNIDASPKDTTLKTVNENGMMGTGLMNEVGEYNCFLNVIIQSLWHIARFQKELSRQSTSEHIHVGDPCVVCALHGIFTALSLASTNHQREAVAPTALRLALSKLCPNNNFFQEGQMNDASEVLGVMFECLHRSSASKDEVLDTEIVKSSCLGSWDCSNDSCVAHFLFGMDIFESMNCHNCHLESRHLKYTSFFHNVNASSLRKMKVVNPDSSFDELLNLVEMQHQLACDPEAGGCGTLNYISHMLSTPPHVFITVLGWQKTRESSEDIIATLSALNTEIDISVLYCGIDPNSKYRLVSLVCYYGQHYHCFAYSSDYGRWLLYDDRTVKVIGAWDEVLKMCERGHLQPQVFFFEYIN
ncbi:unnamed protein product [Rhodiola kirilowii]